MINYQVFPLLSTWMRGVEMVFYGRNPLSQNHVWIFSSQYTFLTLDTSFENLARTSKVKIPIMKKRYPYDKLIQEGHSEFVISLDTLPH